MFTFTLMALRKENMLVAMTTRPRQALRGKNQKSKITFILVSGKKFRTLT